jgi:hypothetical protein
MIDKFPYKFHFYGSDGHYILAVSADTVMYRLFFPSGKYVAGLATAVIDNKKIHPIKNYEGGLLIDWVYDALTSFHYIISNKD